MNYSTIPFEMELPAEPITPGFSTNPTDFETYRQVDRGHGRLEERIITVSIMLKDYTLFPI